MGQIILLIGGARSGKSRHAEALIQAQPAPWRYLATSRAWDDDTRARIDAHRARRHTNWLTIEAQTDLATPLLRESDRPALVDCVTFWLLNLLTDGRDIEAETEGLISALHARSGMSVLVAHEIGMGLEPDDRFERRYRDEAGILHQTLAKIAEQVTLVVAGHAVDLKKPA
ncbi:bifunctional adenosylcobinamide kinase/adenosylcobinamide-phosphate guanylyltransferase [Tanticharoenia sakaeratensis]|jgi:adenosylcobinamide kinase / adenosylcobinamide-phosphate guanylyltransferase|uniref:Bifunctional adenosylcobalamin biosynthesis protein n=1 Tax=Tanticharoenia sakaeratensis NBRC 103193 TaxID=1231623 RepID=A0A0D6MHL3_9PROT|nr:bifunctional adenosylcobinamide kinase/adenosylcobinamide-phosphate guanylyltransferase [Tanticharoenia sakaeratensis]GAN53139.1 adenosylcobinamide kinase [Tanticharoenia sakaeratensis NBRC 103193]GBQ24843.1 adenosylcobalamin biosynthesis bifunctional protein CobP [Tanticharoenia sakaeratensis NBRC 103193]